tara:strand:- start:28003 stop:28242 length:240 start_codon:yes stop_codon:yes gene_type:complete
MNICPFDVGLNSIADLWLNNDPGYNFPRMVKRFLLIISSLLSVKFEVYMRDAIFLIFPSFSNEEICLLILESLEEKIVS